MATVALAYGASALATSAGWAAGTLAATALVTVATGAGAMIDMALINAIQGPIKNSVEGPRLDNARVLTSIEGNPIARVYGRQRISGQCFWATRFKEVVTTETQTQGGKGVGGGREQETTTTTYQYYASFAIGLCEGPIIKLGRIWADGKEVDLSGSTYRVYTGTEDQVADTKIAAIEGEDNTPAFRGLAYIVFEDLLLEPYGNRIPQLNFEVWKFANTDESEMEFRLAGFNIIPGSSEYAYSTDIVRSRLVELGDAGLGWTSNGSEDTERVENSANTKGIVDWDASMDDMQSTCQNMSKAQLVVSWFGDDLRMGNCTIKPKVETHNKTAVEEANAWWCGGIDRATADLVSADDVGPLVGGSPSDLSTFQAIQDLNDRGLQVSFYPFIFMDIPSWNTLPNPYSNNAASTPQPPFPWRGRIVASPAPGFTGSVDKAAGTTTQVNAFFGSAAASDFGTWNGLTIPYTGPAEWSYRRFILHCAKLCAAAGGVDVFYIGTEMVGMTTARSATSTYPAVAKLQTLAADVSAILPSAKISYAADWSEYHSHRPADGSNDVHFHLDPLWADSNIDAVSIDVYLPLSDWRDTPDHLDGQNYDNIYDVAYLQENVEGGEYYDWYYADAADRIAQIRTPITDGDPANEPWIYRNKDLRNWWMNQHHNRPGGTRSGSATSWAAEMKPIYISELGCPAIDKGSNQPNVFYDPKSSESFFPYFSSGARDDYIQRLYIQAWVDYWLSDANNPATTTHYTGRMIKNDETCMWTWDARPFPDFPRRSDLWRDGDNYRLGHWLNGRLGQVALPDLVRAITKDLGVTVDVSKLYGLVTGYSMDRVMSARDAIEPLALLYMFDSYESEGQIRFRHRGGKTNWTLSDADLIPIDESGSVYRLTRNPNLELPSQSLVKYIDDGGDYDQGIVQSRRLIGDSSRVADSTIAVVTSRDKVQAANDIILLDAWLSRERLSIKLPPSFLAMDATDIVQLTLGGLTFEYRVEEINYSYERSAELSRTDRGLYYKAATAFTLPTNKAPDVPVQALIDFVELPIRKDSEAPGGPFLALYSSPWQANSVYRSPTTSDYTLDSVVQSPAMVGNVSGAVVAGPEGAWDYVTVLTVVMLDETTLESKDELQVLAGKNMAAVKASNGEWEIIQWVTATLVDVHTYELTQLLRAQFGTDGAMYAGIDDGAEFVIVPGLTQASISIAQREVLLNWRVGPSSRGINTSSYRTVQYAIKGIGLRPYSPVHLAATKPASDIILTWIRRTRLPESGDTWEGLDVPLGEDTELYEVDIYDAAGTSILRTLSVPAAQTVTYTLAMQTADFGSGQTFVDFEVFQISTTFGRGTGRRLKVTGL